MGGRTIRKREGVDRLRVAAQALSGTIAQVGFFESAKYADGTSVASVAVVQEYGSAKMQVPARPFMRTTVEEQRKTWAEHMRKGGLAVAQGRFTARQVLDSIGALAAGDVRKKIASIKSPPLKENTIAARRRRYANSGKTGNLTKPLVDTAIMVNAVTHVVEEK